MGWAPERDHQDGVEKAHPQGELSEEGRGGRLHSTASLWELHQLLPLSMIHLWSAFLASSSLASVVLAMCDIWSRNSSTQ